MKPAAVARIEAGGAGPGSVPERTRIRGESREMPGLKLTAAQASRFWHLGLEDSRRLLDSLVEDGALSLTTDGFYVFGG